MLQTIQNGTIRKLWIQKKNLELIKVFFQRESSFLSTPKGKLIQTIPRVDHGSLRNKTAETYNFMATPTKCSLSLPATSQIMYLATLLLAFSLCLSHIWCSEYDAFNKHVDKPIIYFWHYFCFFLHQTSFMGWKRLDRLIVQWPFLLCWYETLQSMRMSPVLEIKPCTSHRLTFCPTAKVQREGARPQSIPGRHLRVTTTSGIDVFCDLWMTMHSSFLQLHVE